MCLPRGNNKHAICILEHNQGEGRWTNVHFHPPFPSNLPVLQMPAVRSPLVPSCRWAQQMYTHTHTRRKARRIGVRIVHWAGDCTLGRRGRKESEERTPQRREDCTRTDAQHLLENERTNLPGRGKRVRGADRIRVCKNGGEGCWWERGVTMTGQVTMTGHTLSTASPSQDCNHTRTTMEYITRWRERREKDGWLDGVFYKTYSPARDVQLPSPPPLSQLLKTCTLELTLWLVAHPHLPPLLAPVLLLRAKVFVL